MGTLDIILIAIGLSFDTFAVSICAGLSVKEIKFWQAVRIAIVLALFQGLMPFLGWLGGIQIQELIAKYDHWVAFGLLSLLGIKMIVDTFRKGEEVETNPLLMKVLLLMGLATSIDALVVGISLALVDINIYQSVVIIGITTFMAAMIGMLLGKNANGRLGRNAEIAGGLILIGIGIKILIEHLG